MAVYNNYVDAKILEGRRASAIASQGSSLVSGRVVFDTTAAHDAGSIYRVLRGIPSSAVFKYLHIFTDGVTGMNDVDVCLYKPFNPDGTAGAEIGSEVLASTIDLSSAVTAASPKNGLGNITNANLSKPLWELASQTINSRDMFMDIGLKSVADLSEADTIVVDYAYWAP